MTRAEHCQWYLDADHACNLQLGLETSNKPVEEETETVEVEPMDEDEQIEEELTRLNQEATARARKERRRKNENRQRTIQKLQLQMTTPMDIGMDQYDAALSGGPEDFFDLSTTEGSRKARRLARGEEFDESDEEDIDGVRSEAEDEDDEDEESRLKALEGDMDEMYDQYQQRMQERDAKFKAKEARRKDAHRDEWHGIRDDESDAGSANGDDGSSEGGYDVVERRKNKEETYDTDDEEDDADDAEDAAEEAAEEAAARTRKLASKVASGIKRKHGDEDARLVTSLESQDAAQMRQSKAAAVWFDNPLFKDVPELDLPDEDDVEEEEEEEEEEAASEDDDDFEVVPAEEEDVAEGEWNFSDEDEGERTRKRIAGEPEFTILMQLDLFLQYAEPSHFFLQTLASTLLKLCRWLRRS